MRSAALLVLGSALISTPCFASEEKGQIYEGIGSPVTHEELRLLDIDVTPDQLSLQPGGWLADQPKWRDTTRGNLRTSKTL